MSPSNFDPKKTGAEQLQDYLDGINKQALSPKQWGVMDREYDKMRNTNKPYSTIVSESIANRYVPSHHFNIRRKLAQDILSALLVENKKGSDEMRDHFIRLSWLQRIFYK